MVTIWLGEKEASGIVICETGWLRQTEHIIASDPGYIVSELGWATLDEYLANERRACREPSPDDPVPTAKETGPHVLITMGDWQITSEARRLTLMALAKARGQIG